MSRKEKCLLLEVLEMNKTKLREFFKKERKKIDLEKRKNISKAVAYALFEITKNKTFAASFMPLFDEIDLLDFNKLLLKERKLCLPAIINNQMEFFKVNNFEDLKIGAFGILEPDSTNCEKVFLTSSDIVFVPGLAFDLRGHRLGYGKGFYDKFLKNHSEVASVGVGYEEQLLLQTLTWESHDATVKATFLF